MTFEEWYKQKNPDLESDDLYDELKKAFEAGRESLKSDLLEYPLGDYLEIHIEELGRITKEGNYEV
jgi:hypothetical protein